jgi:hypothetical protein
MPADDVDCPLLSRVLNDACPAAGITKALSGTIAFFALADVESNKPFSCPAALKTTDSLFAVATGAFMHSRILPGHSSARKRDHAAQLLRLQSWTYLRSDTGGPAVICQQLILGRMGADVQDVAHVLKVNHPEL